MTHPLWGQATARWSSKDLFLVILVFLLRNIVFFLAPVFLIKHINKDIKLKKYNNAKQQFKIEREEILNKPCLRQRARKEAGSCWNFFVNSFYTVESFTCPGDIVHISSNSVQLWWPPCNSASCLISVLQLFIQLEDEHCTA